MKKIKRIGVVYDPLDIGISLQIVGGSLTQRHNADKLEYMPDRSITPLVLTPRVYVSDPNGMIPSGYQQCVNAKWYAMPQDIANAIANNGYLENELNAYIIGASGSDYVLGADGSLTVYKNVQYQAPQVLVFTAEIYDVRSGNAVKVMATATLVTTSTVLAKSLELDRPQAWVFDPIHDNATATIHATFKLSGSPLPSSGQLAARYWWYYVEDGVETLIDNDVMLYDGGQDSDTLCIDMRYINGAVTLRCKAELYDTAGLAPATPSSDALVGETRITRRYPEYDFVDYAHGSTEVSPDTEKQKHECIVTVGQSVIDYPEDHFIIKWYVRPFTFGSTWIESGQGDTFYLPKNYFLQGCDVALELDEKEALGLLCVGGGALCVNDKPLTA